MRIDLFILTVFILVFSAPPAFANLDAADMQAVKQAEDYLNKLGTARARFVQTTHNGQQLVGTFYLDRPGKLRFEYDEPIEDFVVADGFFIYFYDSEAGEQSNAPIGQTLADFILRSNLKLDGDDVEVRDVESKAGILRIELVQSADPDAGKLILGFDENPFTLKKWRVVDAQGLITEVELFYLKTDIKHTDGLFVYKAPQTPEKKRYNN